MEKIELTSLELEMLERDLRGEFFPPKQTDEENKAFANVINKADTLMRKLDAYDELGNSLMVWFYRKYKAQEAKKNILQQDH